MKRRLVENQKWRTRLKETKATDLMNRQYDLQTYTDTEEYIKGRISYGSINLSTLLPQCIINHILLLRTYKNISSAT